jgi:hypothetical protein
MMETLAAAALFWLGYFLGNAVGEKSGYNKGWKDKEYGSPLYFLEIEPLLLMKLLLNVSQNNRSKT